MRAVRGETGAVGLDGVSRVMERARSERREAQTSVVSDGGGVFVLFTSISASMSSLYACARFTYADA